MVQLNAEIARLQTQLDALQPRVDAASVRLQRASHRAGQLRGSVTGLEATWSVVSGEDRQAIAGTIDAAREAFDSAEHRFSSLMAGAKRDPAVSQLLEAQQRIAWLSIQRDLAALEAGALEGSGPPTAQPGVARLQAGAWAHLFLQAIGAPACSNNLVVVVAWQAAEGTPAAWNPLATTLASPGSSTFNPVGVQNYPSVNDGVHAAAQTLRNGYLTHGYGWILYDLAVCAFPTTTAQAINASDWCLGCANGAYVTGLVSRVQSRYDWYASR